MSSEHDYLRSTDEDGCSEFAPTIGWCDLSGPHITHEARAASGTILGRWKVRKVIERVEPEVRSYAPLRRGE